MSATIAQNQPTSAPPPNQGKYFHWTVDTFYRAVDAGVFDEPKQLELINGELWKKETLNPLHAYSIRRAGRLLRRLFEPTFLVNEEKPLHLANDGEPVPDFYIASGIEDDYEIRHPTQDDVVLVIEVADTTAIRDTGEKALLYAQAGIEDYWVMLVNSPELLVFRNPGPEGYAPPLRLNETDTITPLIAPNIVISVRDLLPHAPEATVTEQG